MCIACIADVYLTGQAQTQQHDEEKWGPQLKDRHGGKDFWVKQTTNTKPGPVM